MTPRKIQSDCRTQASGDDNTEASLLGDTDVAVQPLSRTYARGLYIEPHEHVWGQLLYAMSGLLRELILRLVEQGDDQQQDDYEALVSLALLDLKRARRTSRRILAKV